MTIFLSITCGYFAGVLSVIVVMVWCGRKLIQSQIAAEQARLAVQRVEAEKPKRLPRVQLPPDWTAPV